MRPFADARVVVGLGQHVLDLHRPDVEKGAADDTIPGGRSREDAVNRRGLLRRQAVDRHKVQPPVLEPEHRAELGLAQLRRARDNGLEYRPDVARRAREHAQDLARGTLPGQGVGALDRSSLELLWKRGCGLLQINVRVVGHRLLAPALSGKLGTVMKNYQLPPRTWPSLMFPSKTW